jgi:hypothetical protein
MTLAEQLLEEQEIKTILLQAVKNNASVGAVLSHTTNNTKLVYEGATATMKLLRETNARIATLEANIAQLKMVTC